MYIFDVKLRYRFRVLFIAYFSVTIVLTLSILKIGGLEFVNWW